jgi:hypothetical protein
MPEFNRNEESQLRLLRRSAAHQLRGSAAHYGTAALSFWPVRAVPFMEYGARTTASDTTVIGEAGMALAELDLDPDTADIMRTAFDKSWQFVKGDPELAHNNLEEMRALLSRHIARLARSGERDLWRLANSAIGQLRRERSAA